MHIQPHPWHWRCLGFELSEPLIDADPAADGYCRVVASSKEEAEGNIPKKSTQSVLSHLYPKNYTRPTMEEALAEADLAEEQVKKILNVCESLQMKGGCLRDLSRMQLRWPCTPTTLGPRTLRATRTES